MTETGEVRGSNETRDLKVLSECIVQRATLVPQLMSDLAAPSFEDMEHRLPSVLEGFRTNQAKSP
jgi:hypothetical protein